MEVRPVLLPAHGEGAGEQLLRLVQLIMVHNGVEKGLAAVPVGIGLLQLLPGLLPGLLAREAVDLLQQGVPMLGAQLHIPPAPQGEPQNHRQQSNRNIKCLHASASFATQVMVPASSTVIKNTCLGEVRRRSFSCLSSQTAS